MFESFIGHVRIYMSHGLADNVDTSFTNRYKLSCTTGAVFSKLRDQLASLEGHDALSLCGS